MKALWKNSYREITRAPGRFLAILLIIMLGSGFFVGLRVTRDAMIKTADVYLDDYKFYDFAVSGTLGLTDDDVEAFLQDENVLSAEGSVSTDALVSGVREDDIVVTFMSLTETVNTPEMIEGRYPENPNECIADEKISGIEIGSKIVLSEQNDEDTDDMFAQREFTVVGIACSPLYLNYERGNTSLGAGTVSGFVYLPKDSFDCDYYTTIYLRMTDMPEAYTDEYDNRIDLLEPEITALSEERSDIRYNTIVSDATDELNKGIADYEDGVQEYNDEKEKAERELDDAWQELEDAKQKIADAKVELADGWTELDDSRAEGEQELKDASKKLADAYRELTDGEEDYSSGVKEYEDGEAQYAQSLKEYEDGESQYSDGLAKYEDGKTQYEDGMKEYNDGVDEYQKALSEYNEGKEKYESGLKDYNSGVRQYQDGLNSYKSGEAALNESKSQLDEAKSQLDTQQESFDTLMQSVVYGVNQALSPYGMSFSTSDELFYALQSDDEQTAGTVKQTVDGVLQMIKYQAGENGDSIPSDSDTLIASKSALDAGWQQYNEGLAAYELGQQQLASSAAQLNAADRQLDEAWAQLVEAKAELADGEAQLKEAEDQLNEAWAELENAKAELDEGEKELQDSREKLDEGKKELDDARAELDDAKSELENARAELDDGWSEYYDGVQSVKDGWNELNASVDEATQKLNDAQQEIDDGEKEYDDGLKEYYDGKREADEKLSDAAQELSDAASDIEDAKAEIADIKYPNTYVLGRWGNVGYACFDNDSAIVKSVSTVFPIFFFLVAALICVTTITRMVDEERSQLGVLMALGYSKSAIMGKYLMYSGSATVIGCAIGIIGASYLFPQILWQAYSIMYSFTDKLVFYIDPALSIGTFVAYVAVMLFVTWYSCKSELSETPANIIRPKPPKSGKRVLLERIPIIWNHLSFMWKVTMRNIFRYKQRVLMMILGIGGCTALMITGFGIQDSISDIVSYQYRDITMYDYDVTFSDPLTESDMAEFTDSVSQYTGETLFVYQKSMTVMADKAEKAAYVTVVPESDRIESFMDFHKNSTHLDFPSDGEALINSGLADILGVKAGDTITVVGNGNENMSLTVSGVYDNYIYNYVYMTGETYEKLTGETPEIKTACIIGSDGEDASLVTAKLLNEKGVITVSSSTAMAERINNMMKNLVYIVILTIVCAAALAFIVIYNLTNINITERMREIATVKVLGFYNWESATYVLRENILLTILGALLGIPLGIALNAFVITKINIDLIAFQPVIMPTSYLYSIMFTFLFSILVDIVMYKKLNKINSAEALKAAE